MAIIATIGMDTIILVVRLYAFLTTTMVIIFVEDIFMDIISQIIIRGERFIPVVSDSLIIVKSNLPKNFPTI